MAQIVTKQADSTAAATLGTRYIFGELVEREVYVTLRANVTFSAVVELSTVRAAVHLFGRLPELQGAARAEDIHVQRVWPR